MVRVVKVPGATETKRGLLGRRHCVAAFLVAALLLSGAGFAWLEDGGIPTLDRGGVVAALAADAGSSLDSDRMRTAATRGAERRPGSGRPGPPPISS
jgi:hypothetical protein